MNNGFFDIGMMTEVAQHENLQEFDISVANNHSRINLRCVEQICRDNKLLSLTIQSPFRVAGFSNTDECLGLIADNCRGGLQKLSIISRF
jgi:hypothetical protein